MKEIPAPDPAKLAASFDKLSAAAASLNGVSDLLAKSIAEVEDVFQKLNVGVPAWAPVVDGEYEDQTFYQLFLGYAKVGPKWGVAIRTLEGHQYIPEQASEEIWLFNDAPRRLRIQTIDHLPLLVDELTKAAADAADKVNQKLDAAQQVAAALRAAAKNKAGKK